ncbi:MAG: hypothetical protein QXL15_02545, partial [Candidatus Korarchaeota archaeon]
ARKVGELEGEVSALRATLRGKEDEISLLNAKLRKYEESISQLTSERSKLMAENESLKTKISALEKEKVEAVKKVVTVPETKKYNISLDVATEILRKSPLGTIYLMLSDLGRVNLHKLSLTIGRPIRETVMYVKELAKMGVVSYTASEDELLSNPNVEVQIVRR